MKIIFTTLIMLIGLSSFSQTNFKKTESTNGEKYFLEGVVSVENGHSESVDVTASASVKKEIWDSFVAKLRAVQDSSNRVNNKNHIVNDSTTFSFVLSMLTIKAKYTLKNSSSFVPLSKQFFTWYNGEFTCSYKMMGRNGYGNLVETESLVFYRPE